jgi:two-component system, OmpR family, response regulator
MTDAAISVLLIEDDLRLAELTIKYLQRHELLMTHMSDGTRGLAEATRRHYDVILLDVMLPGKDGITLCRELRTRSSVPVIMLTARGEEADRVLGLEGGADDYVAKPFSSRELLARIRVQVRRSRGQAGPSTQTVQVGGLMIDPNNLTATFHGQELLLTGYEFTLLRVLAERAGRVMTREQLLDLAKGSAEESFDRSIDVHISRLRKKLGDDPQTPKILKTLRGVGYMFAADKSSY